LRPENVIEFIEGFESAAPAQPAQASGSSTTGAAVDSIEEETNKVLREREAALEEALKGGDALVNALKKYSDNASADERKKLRKVLRYAFDFHFKNTYCIPSS